MCSVFLPGGSSAAGPSWRRFRPGRVRWRDLHVPADDVDALDAFQEAWRRAETERVEVACWGGRGRTGTALACIAILDGVPAAEAVAFVRQNYRRSAVETPWQRRYVARFRRPDS